MSIRFYEGSNLIDKQFVDFPSSTMPPLAINFAADSGNYTISVKVDEDGIKIESDEQNNDASADATFLAWFCGDADGSGAVDIDDVVHLINYIFAGGPHLIHLRQATQTAPATLTLMMWSISSTIYSLAAIPPAIRMATKSQIVD